jgi:hypothetical protein
VRGHFEEVEELGGGVWGRGERGERVAEEDGAAVGEALLAEGLGGGQRWMKTRCFRGVQSIGD